MFLKLCLCVVTLFVSAGVTQSADDSYPRPDLLVEPTELNQPDVAMQYVVLDVREKAKYDEGHIPNAVSVDLAGWSKSFAKGDDAAGWSKRIGAMGIGKDTKVVVYDDSSSRDAARTWWILRYWGVADVRLLNGGWTGWKAAGNAVSKDAAVPVAVTFEAQGQLDRLATKEQLLKSLDGGQLQIVDSRSEKEFCGVEKMSNKRGGAIPGAVQLDWSDLIDQETKRFKSAVEMKELFDAAGIDLTRKSTTYCQSGGRASVMAFAMELMGSKEVSNYYPSWSEWGNADDTPVVAGKPKEKK